MSESACEPCSKIYFRLSDYQKNIKNYSESLLYLKWVGSNCSKQTFAGKYYYKTAQIYLLQDKIDDAIAIMDEGIAAVELLNDTSNLIGMYNQKGLIAKRGLQYREAVDAFEQAIDFVTSTGIRPKLEPVLMGNIGSCYMANGEWEKAYTYLEADAKGSLEGEEYGSYCNAMLALVEIDCMEGRFTTAKQLLTDLERDHAIHFGTENWIAYYNLSAEVAAKQEDYKKAYECAEREKNYKDSLNELSTYQNNVLYTEYSGKLYQEVSEQNITSPQNQGPIGIAEHWGKPRIPVVVYRLVVGVLALSLILALIFRRRKS